LILVRSVFRVAEFIDGNHGALMRKEAYVFVFDGFLMVIVLLWMNGLELMKIRQGRKRYNTMESLNFERPLIGRSNGAAHQAA
jgi:hypothetical protein